MSVGALLDRLASVQIELWLEDGSRLRFRAPQGVLSESLRAELTEKREVLIAHLRQAAEPGPLTLGQQALIFHSELWPESSTYNLSLALRLRGALAEESLVAALAELANRHPLLATRLRATATGSELYRAEGAGLPLHRVTPALPVELVRVRALAAAHEPFRLYDEPLTRATLYACTDGDAVLHLCCHHMVADGSSFAIILRDLPVLYAHHRKGTPPPARLRHSFTEFARWQAAFLASAAAAAPRRYWLDQLAGELPTLQLPVDHRRRGVRSESGDEVPLALGPGLSQRLRSLAIDLGVTPSALLLAGLAALCARYGECDEVIIGVPYSGRSDPRFAEVVGYFVNTLPVRLGCAWSVSFAELARTTATQLGDAVASGDYPLARLVEELPRARVPHAPTLYQVSFSFHSQRSRELLHNAVGAAETALPFADLLALPLPLPQQNGQDELALTIFDHGSEFGGKLSYSTELFTQATALRMAGHLRVLLQKAVDTPELPIGHLPLLSAEEYETVVKTWNCTAFPRDAEWSLPKQLSQSALATPAAVALQSEERCLTYGQLEQQSNQLAWHLRRLGVGPDVLVGLYLPRSPELVIAVCAVLKAGAAFLPLDPELPPERLRWQLDDSAVPLVLALRPQLPPAPAAVRVIIINETNLDAEPITAPEVAVASHHLAYALYTSGSTGWPKAALVEQGALQNQLLWLQRTYGYRPGDVALQQTSISFDVFVCELLAPLLGGAKLVQARPGGHRDTRYLAALIEQAGVHIVNIVPTLLRALLADLEPGRCSSLTRILCGGEVLDPTLAASCHRQLPHAELVNLYGPTECTVNSTSWRYGGEPDSVPIGRPVDNTSVYVLDPLGQPTPIGVAGELYIGGVQVCRGYLNRPELTAQRIIPDPFAAVPAVAPRLYRTGDNVRWLASGTLEFLGRRDTQVKLRGQRIELGEIEAALRAQPGVRDCAVIVEEAAKSAARLVAYILPAAPLRWQELRAALQQRLPEVMIPALWITVAMLPKTASGKLARNQLPPPDPSAAAPPPSVPEPPRTPQEAALLTIFATVLQRDDLDASAHFFALGGHSLQALQVMARIRQQLGVELPLRALFDAPTVRLLALQLAERPTKTVVPRRPADREPANSVMMLSPSQRFIWQYEQRTPSSAYNNVPEAMWLHGRLDAKALQQALDALLSRHEMLRVHINEQAGELTQRPVAPMPWPLAFIDLSAEGTSRPLADVRAHALVLANQAARKPFDLGVPPLARAEVYRTALDEHLVLLVFHHIVTDGWSMTILWRELAALYIAVTMNTPAALSPIRVSYADYLRELPTILTAERRAAGVAFFREQLAGLPMLQLPTDYPRSAERKLRGDFHEIAIDSELTSALKALAVASGSTCYMVMLTAAAVQLAAWSGQRGFRLGLPVAARIHPDYEALVGCFTNTIVLGVDLRDELSFAAALARVRSAVLEALTHELTPLGEVIAAVEAPPPSGYAAGFQALVTHQVLAFPRLPGLSMRPAAVFGGITKRDIHIHIAEYPDRVFCELLFDRDLFSPTTIAGFAAHYLALLRRVVADASTALATPAGRRS